MTHSRKRRIGRRVHSIKSTVVTKRLTFWTFHWTCLWVITLDVTICSLLNTIKEYTTWFTLVPTEKTLMPRDVCWKIWTIFCIWTTSSTPMTSKRWISSNLESRLSRAASQETMSQRGINTSWLLTTRRSLKSMQSSEIIWTRRTLSTIVQRKMRWKKRKHLIHCRDKMLEWKKISIWMKI